ncbi:MAG TPA: hypothetical protein VGM90_27595 [Kofleriaceae bacterium]|jgi:hypothetical protein
MRNVLVFAAVVLAASSAAADTSLAGVYNVKYEDVSNNCPSPLKYPNGTMEVKSSKGAAITVDIDRTPIMSGSSSKNGKVSAKSKIGDTSLQGMKGSFSVAGKISPEGLLSLVMVGEYQANGKALCTQTWNVTGVKSDDAPATQTAPKKK